jgi:hypothetical protein
MPKLGLQLPRLYKDFIPSSIWELDLVEVKANCNHCYMAHHKTRNKKRFDEKLKCCTYYPMMPNFLVGALLQDPATSLQGRAVFREHIEKRRFSLPIGMLAPVQYQVMYKKSREENFGLNKDWLCPYFDRVQNNCSIWRNRGAVCTSFFCVSDYGDSGKKFWSGLEDYLTYVEMALLEEALVRLDFSPRQISEQMEFLNRHDGKGWELETDSLPLDLAKRLWNGYYDEQEEFFMKTYQIVQNFSKKDYPEIMGELGHNVERQLIAKGEALARS